MLMTGSNSSNQELVHLLAGPIIELLKQFKILWKYELSLSKNLPWWGWENFPWKNLSRAPLLCKSSSRAQSTLIYPSSWQGSCQPPETSSSECRRGKQLPNKLDKKKRVFYLIFQIFLTDLADGACNCPGHEIQPKIVDWEPGVRLVNRLVEAEPEALIDNDSENAWAHPFVKTEKSLVLDGFEHQLTAS